MGKTMVVGVAGFFGHARRKTEGEGFEGSRRQLHVRIGERAVVIDFPRKSPNSPVDEKKHPKLSMRTQCKLPGLAP